MPSVELLIKMSAAINPQTRHLLFLCAGLTAGWGLGRLGRNPVHIASAQPVEVTLSANGTSSDRGSRSVGSGRVTATSERSIANLARHHADAAITAARGGDLRKALRGVVSVVDPSIRQAVVMEFIRNLPADQLAVILDEFEGVENEFRGHQNSVRAAASTWELIASAIVERGPEEFLDAKLRKAGEQASETDFESVLSAWADRDLPATVAYFNERLRSLPSSEMQGAAGHLAVNYFRTDPDNAVKWLGTLPEEVRAKSVHFALTDLSQGDPAAAARILANHRDLPGGDDLARQIAQRYVNTDPQQAWTWASGLPPEQSKLAMRGVLDQWMDTDFDSAFARISSLDEGMRTVALPGLAEKAPLEQLPQIARSLGGASGDEHQRSAAASLAARWTEQDAISASRWIGTHPPGPIRDSALRAFADTLVRSDPASAYDWASTISDPGLRRETLDDGIRGWLDRDPEAARAWVQNSTVLGKDDRERLLRRSGR